MDITLIISIVSSFAVLFLGLVFKESITQVIRRYYANASDKQIGLMYMFLLATCMAIVFISPELFIGQDNDLKKEKPEAASMKTKPEIYADIAEKGVEDIIDWSKQMKQFREEKIRKLTESKEEVWVYQIGSLHDKRSLLKEYDRLSLLPDVQILKISKREYLIFSFGGMNSQEALSDSILVIDQQLDSIADIDNRVKVINLSLECPAKKKIVRQTLNLDKEHKEVDCYVCD